MFITATFDELKQLVPKRASIAIAQDPLPPDQNRNVAVLNAEGSSGVVWSIPPTTTPAQIQADFPNAVVVTSVSP